MELRTLRYFLALAPERTTRSVLIWKKNQVFNTATSLFIQSLQLLRDDAGREDLSRPPHPQKKHTKREKYKGPRSQKKRGGAAACTF